MVQHDTLSASFVQASLPPNDLKDSLPAGLVAHFVTKRADKSAQTDFAFQVLFQLLSTAAHDLTLGCSPCPGDHYHLDSSLCASRFSRR